STRNVISDNCSLHGPAFGIAIVGNSNVVTGNYIGTSAAGDTALGNVGAAGIGIFGDYNFICKPIPGAGNVISANFTNAGIEIDAHLPSPSLKNVIQNNLIGTDATGLIALPNTLDGIVINAGSGTQIGGPAPFERNVISGNTRN